MSLQACSIQQVYSIAKHNLSQSFGIPYYHTPHTYMENLSVYQPTSKHSISKDLNKSPNKRPNQKSNQKKPFIPFIQLQQNQKPKPIPSNKSYQKEKWQKNTCVLGFRNSPATFAKEKFTHTYISKEKIENNDIGPGKYDLGKYHEYFDTRNDFRKHSKPNKDNFRRRIYSQGIESKSLQTPGVGQYNIRNAPGQLPYCHHTQWPKHQPSQSLKLSQSTKKLSKKQIKPPSSMTYNPLPRSYSLFSTLQLKEKQVLNFREYNRKLNLKKSKNTKDLKSNVGPGKYLTLDDWKDKTNDKKGLNFVNRVKTQSVYR